MGAVYQATDVRLERIVAVKVLLGTMFDDAVARQRFAREARASARIVHPNVVGVFDFGELDGGAYLVLEYLSGETLRQRLERGGPLDGATLERVLSGLFDGVAAAHAQGVVHRDLKPENVFLTSADGAIVTKVLDFGLAIGRDAEFSEGGRLTRTGTAVGTLAYMSPEQLAGDPVDERTDIHALGIVVLEALTGSIESGGPFFTRADAVLGERLSDANERDRAIARAVRRAVHERREERHASVAELRAALSDAMTQTSTLQS
jgi:serine/threonine protein kinase